MAKLIGWSQHGVLIPTPDGIHCEDYFRNGRYLGPDCDGVEPLFDIGYRKDANRHRIAAGKISHAVRKARATKAGKAKTLATSMRRLSARRDFKTGVFLHTDLAVKYGVSARTIGRWCSGIYPGRTGLSVRKLSQRH